MSEQTFVVSIHVPARGTTVEGGFKVVKYEVSIHVPARGTTVTKTSIRQMYDGFNPRSRKGNDRNSMFHALLDNVFQSTFPQGERQY